MTDMKQTSSPSTMYYLNLSLAFPNANVLIMGEHMNAQIDQDENS